jgi:serine/threonine protein kinase
MIGPYKLKEQIGEGGFGLVFVAEQQEPVRRKVALKVIKPGMDSRQVITRFEAERQALALMDHPNIARVLDAGATDSGRPYFVMELVRGIPITDYCDKNQLSPRDRLDLFITVCQAVQHAHQKGIIHRDIKPSNVLVTSHDGKPVAKVIDFGVAKAINQQLTERSIYTNFAQMIGTPLYMSPEQAEMSGLDIDTRSDIYSLGVLLYELLTGTTPLDKKRFAKAAYDEIRRMIREDEPQKPSTRLSTSDSIASIAAQRHIEPARLSKLMRGDLDWITMKALEKDRTRRYETANGLARDIQRYLSDEPVEACPPSATYRLRKFARKNRAALATASLFAITLVLFSALCIWFAIDSLNAQHRAAAAQALAEQERDRATAAAEAEKQAKVGAQAREAETKAVLDFVENKVFAAARPRGQEGGQGYEVKLADAITAALPYVEKSFADQPLIEARLRMTLGLSFSYLGKDDVAEEQFRRARNLFTAKLGPDHPYTLASMHNLANSYYFLGRHPEALALREETLKLTKARLGPDHPDTLGCMNNLAQSYAAVGRHPEALALREETLKLKKAKLGPDHPDTLLSMSNLAYSYADLGRQADALRFREAALAVWKAKYGDDHPETLRSRGNLADSYAAFGRYSDAIKLYEEVLSRRGDFANPGDSTLVAATKGLARCFGSLGQRNESAAYWLKAQALAPTDTDVLLSAAAAVLSAGDAEKYTALRRQAIEQFSGTTDPTTAERVAKACLLTPPPPADLPRIIALADTAVTRGKDHEWLFYFQMARGMAAYRAGDWAATLDWCGRSRQGRPDWQSVIAQNLLFEAMAHDKLGNTQRAAVAMAEAARLIDDYRAELPGGGKAVSHDWLMCDIIRKEAESVLKN